MKSTPHDSEEATELLTRLLEVQGQSTNCDPLLSRREAATYLGLSPRTLAIWAHTGRYGLEVVKIGRLSKYRRSSLDLFINERVK